MLEWSRETFGVTVNEFYGQTECNLVVSNCAEIMPVKPGSMGRPVPGHRVAVIDDDGNECPRGTPAALAVRRPHPVLFLGHWRNPQATAAKLRGDCLMTGDQGIRPGTGQHHMPVSSDATHPSDADPTRHRHITTSLRTHP